MGFWSTVARIGGYALAPVTGGLSIPVGEAVAQGIGNRDATTQANEQLQQGVTQAAGVLQPYTNLGGQAANTLGGLMGFAPSGGGGEMAPSFDRAGAAKAIAGRVGDMWNTWMDEDDGRTIKDLRSSPHSTLADFAAPQVAQQQTRSAFVRMRAPDGSEELDVPADQVAYFRQRGAQPIGRA